MIAYKLAWLTDIHLNFLKQEARKQFYQKVASANADAIIITGDIAEAPSVCELLVEFSSCVNKEFYFVLGNHDYYLGNVTTVRQAIQHLCNQHEKLHWLGKPEIGGFSSKTVLVGHDGWADARYGDFDHSQVTLNDSRYIAELFQAACLGKARLKDEMQKLADIDAAILEKTLYETIEKNNPKTLIIATHVPPFKECCQYQGKQSDENWQPYFSSKATGDVISAAAIKYPMIDFLVLCGHTHTKHAIKPLSNLQVKVGGAEYYQPEIQKIIEIKNASLLPEGT